MVERPSATSTDQTVLKIEIHPFVQTIKELFYLAKLQLLANENKLGVFVAFRRSRTKISR